MKNQAKPVSKRSDSTSRLQQPYTKPLPAMDTVSEIVRQISAQTMPTTLLCLEGKALSLLLASIAASLALESKRFDPAADAADDPNMASCFRRDRTLNKKDTSGNSTRKITKVNFGAVK